MDYKKKKKMPLEEQMSMFTYYFDVIYERYDCAMFNLKNTVEIKLSPGDY